MPRYSQQMLNIMDWTLKLLGFHASTSMVAGDVGMKYNMAEHDRWMVWSWVSRFANDCHEWCSHEWNHCQTASWLTIDQEILGNKAVYGSYIVLFLTQAFIFPTHEPDVNKHRRLILPLWTWTAYFNPILWHYVNVRHLYFEVILAD